MKRKRRRGGLVRACICLAMILALALAFPKILERIRYPVKYASEIRWAAGEYGMDPALVAAIVNTESGYDPRATSGVGARGLMQIMPDTGRWIAGKLGEKDAYTDMLLYDANASLRYGCWYMDFLIRRYGGNIVSAIAAYHAGQGCVDDWLKDRAYSSDGRRLDLVPDSAPSTRHYVNKVQKAYEYYQEAYR